MATSFAPFAADFLRLTADIVWCTVTTVDAQGRPRSRILHPIFEVRDGLPVGWIATGRTPIKVADLAGNPQVACSYWSPAQNTVSMNCEAKWVEDIETKRYVFDLFNSTPPPLGYELTGLGMDDIAGFTPLRLEPWRVQIMVFEGWDKNLTPRTWRQDER